MEKVKYLAVTFTNDGKQDKELGVKSSNASAVMGALHHSVISKQELLRNAKLFESPSSPMVNWYVLIDQEV